MSAEAISRAPRRYWRRMARYNCPDPEIMIRHLYDVFSFFKDMKDPSRPEHNFFVADAWAIFVKEIGYVQKGYLSDLPGMNMYVYQRTCARTGFIFYRSRRSSSALEGYHLHLRAAQHPTAKGQAGPRLEIARTDLCDFSWNQRAGRKAGQLRDHGHDRPWLVDALHDVCAGAFEGPDAPPALQGSRRLDTSLEPVTWHGINWEGLGRLAAQGAQAVHLASLRSPADVAKVLLHPLLIVRGDAAGIVDILPGTTRAFAALRRTVVIELQGDAHDFIALPMEERRHDRRIDAARHCHHHTGVRRSALYPKAVHGGE